MMNMDQSNSENTTPPPTASGVTDQPTTLAGLTRNPSTASTFPLLTALLDSESAVDVASTMTPPQCPASVAAAHENPAAHPFAALATTTDSAAHVASSTAAEVMAVPSTTASAAAAAAAAEPINENVSTIFRWNTSWAHLERQEAATRQAPIRQRPPQGPLGDDRNARVVRETYYAKAYPCDICRYHFDVHLDRREALVNWFRDSDNLDYHVLFLLSVLFATGLSMSLTFAWLEASQWMANWPLWLTVPLGIALAVHSCVWACVALYCLWQYPKAFWRWKNQTLPLVAQHFLRMTTTSDPAADQMP
ncbi:uncharacterized protein [Dermacentor andersoni]|uniref:uncharacterized protein n=1 Tax=Dermacentor andersoni TaxID=34620 RepID=UPI002415A06A|nr:uncharacterized protein LOC126518320 [Dermacentor andersoni]XP_054920377.1 uncharacterized protein LOC126518320 [Dermacentor andersoni]